MHLFCIGDNSPPVSYLSITGVLLQFKVRGDSAESSSLCSNFREIWRCLLKSEVCSKLVLWERHTISSDEWVSPCGHELLQKYSIKFKSFENTVLQKGASKRWKIILYFLKRCFSISVYDKNLKIFFRFNLYSYFVPWPAVRLSPC